MRIVFSIYPILTPELHVYITLLNRYELDYIVSDRSSLNINQPTKQNTLLKVTSLYSVKKPSKYISLEFYWYSE